MKASNPPPDWENKCRHGVALISQVSSRPSDPLRPPSATAHELFGYSSLSGSRKLRYVRWLHEFRGMMIESRSQLQPSSEIGPSPRFLFIVGAPRSGTSWIQKSLSEEPGWVTVPELHYTAEVLRPALTAWNRRARALERSLEGIERTGRQEARLIGMPASLEYEELVSALREPLHALVARASALYGTVTVFIEKSPGNSVLIPYLSQVVPDAYILHVLRDPRSMVRSLRSASSGWGAGWAPRSVVVSAFIWRAYVAGARRGKSAGPRYLEVRYEEARQSLSSEVARIQSWLGVEVARRGQSRVRQEVVSSRVRRALGATMVGEPEGFGDGSSVRPELSRLQLWLVEAVTAQLMEECGYRAHSSTAKWVNARAERMIALAAAKMSDERKEDIALNIRRLRLVSWIQEKVRRSFGVRGPSGNAPS